MEKGIKHPETRAVSDQGLQAASDHGKAVPGHPPWALHGGKKNGINAATEFINI